MTIEIGAIVLTAGRSERFSGGEEGWTKLDAEFEGKPLVRYAVEAALGCGAHPVVVVTGHARDQVMASLAGLDVKEAHNPDYETGIASSVKAGIAALPPSNAGAVVFLGDMPRVTAALARKLIAAFMHEPTTDAVAPIVMGRRGNPILLSRSLFPDAMHLAGDEGARKLLIRKDVHVTEVPAGDSGAAVDIDTREELAALRAGGAK